MTDMTDEITLQIYNPDHSHKAEIDIDRSAPCREILEEAQYHWRLPKNESYKLVNLTAGKELRPEKTLAEEDVRGGDLLRVQPIYGCLA